MLDQLGVEGAIDNPGAVLVELPRRVHDAAQRGLVECREESPEFSTSATSRRHCPHERDPVTIGHRSGVESRQARRFVFDGEDAPT